MPAVLTHLRSHVARRPIPMARLEKFSTSRWCDAEITVDRHHVRGSSLLALSSLACRGLPQSTRSRTDAHSGRKQSRAASVHIDGEDCGRQIKLRGGVAVVGRFCETPAFLQSVSDTDALQFVSPRVSHAPKEQTDAAGDVLNCVNNGRSTFTSIGGGER